MLKLAKIEFIVKLKKIVNMKNEELRKVKITKYEDGSGDHVTNGYFHKWIEETHEGESGLVKENYALIELEDGQVRGIRPFRIKFVESF